MDRFRGRILPDSVVQKLESLCAMGQLDLTDLDERAFDALKELNEDGALIVLEQFAGSDLSHVQNKSAFLCGIMKTHREKRRQEQMGSLQNIKNENDQAATQQLDIQGGPNEEKIRELLDRTGYNLDITMGQRKYGGPPPGWEGCQPATGPSGCCQVFVGKVPRDMFEDELIPPFEKYGRIYDFRLMMDPHTGQNKGYAFCTFGDRDSAQSACKGLDNTEIRKNRRLGVCISIANDRLFVGSIPKTKTKQDILDEFRQHTDNLNDVIVYMSAEDKNKNRGFAFLEYESHKAAALARRRLMSGRVKVWGSIVPSVDWADPLEEPDTETMAKVRVVHVRNVSPNTTEETLNATFSEYGEVERVKKLKSYAFINFKERDAALRAIDEMNGKTIDGLVIDVSLAKPPQNREKRHGQSGFGALNAPGKQMPGGDMMGRGRGYMGGRGGPRGRGRGGPRGGGYGSGYNEGYGGGYNEGYGDGYGGGNGYGGGYNGSSYGSGYDDGYGGSYGGGYGGGYDDSYGSSYGGGYDESYGGGDYSGGYGGGNSRGGNSRGGGPQRGRGGPSPRGGPRGRGGPGGPRGGPPGRGGRGGPPRGGPAGRGAGARGGPRGGPRGGGPHVQVKRKYEGEGGGAGTVSYPEPKRRFNQAGSQPIAQQPLEQNNQGYGGGGYDQNNQWYQDSSNYQQWS